MTVELINCTVQYVHFKDTEIKVTVKENLLEVFLRSCSAVYKPTIFIFCGG
jgi:hypothetical protein